MLTIDASAYDGCLYECNTAEEYAQALSGLVAQASAVGLGLIVRGHVYRAEDDDIVATVTEAPPLQECRCESSLCDHEHACPREADPRLVMEYVEHTCTQCAANMAATGGGQYLFLA